MPESAAVRSRRSRHLPAAVLAANVEHIADLLDQLTGRCTVCDRPVRLIVGGLVPPHPNRVIGGWYCRGSELLPRGVTDEV